MTEHPIIFSANMVRAILAGRKTQTRRVANATIYINLNGPVRGDWPIGHQSVAPVGRYLAHLNPHGAVSVETPSGLLGVKPDEFTWECPYGQPGDLLWVREGFAVQPELWAASHSPQPLHFLADCKPEQIEDYVCKPSIHMPRWASRITLGIVSVRVERLQEISVRDALAEGEQGVGDFCYLWDSINAKRGYSWESNPWVWVIEFKRI
mgnify:CR=1 FL=1